MCCTQRLSPNTTESGCQRNRTCQYGRVHGVEEVEDRAAFRLRHVLDRVREHRIDEDRLPPGHGMRADHRVFGRGNDFGPCAPMPVGARVVHRAVSIAVSPEPIALVTSRDVCRVRGGEDGIAADRGTVFRFRSRPLAAAGRTSVGEPRCRRCAIRLRRSAWTGRTSGCPSGPGVGWMCSSPNSRPTPCADRGQLVVAEEDDLMRHQRVVHLLELLVAERLREVSTENLGPNGRCHGIPL